MLSACRIALVAFEFGALVCFASAVIPQTGQCSETPTRRIIRRTTPSPSRSPTKVPTVGPTRSPTKEPSVVPTEHPTGTPTRSPSNEPTTAPTQNPSKTPTQNPSKTPTNVPTHAPTKSPSTRPTGAPTPGPSKAPTDNPTNDVTPRGEGSDCVSTTVNGPHTDVSDWNDQAGDCPGPGLICRASNDNAFATTNDIVDNGTIDCYLDNGDTVSLLFESVNVVDGNKAGVTMSLVSSSNYLMSGVYVKGGNEGGQAYFWGVDDSSTWGEEGGVTGYFETPTQQQISHLTLCVIPVPTSCHSCPEGWALLQTWDLITVNDFYMQNSEVEGKVFVGRDYTSSTTAQMGVHLSDTADVTFAVAGSISGTSQSLKIHKGSLGHSPDVTSYEQNNYWYVDGRQVEIQQKNSGNAAKEDSEISQTSADFKKHLEDLSSFLSSLEATSGNFNGVSPTDSNKYLLEVDNVDENGTAVFEIEASNVFARQNTRFEIELGQADPNVIIINVKGTSITFNSGFSMAGTFLTNQNDAGGRSRVIYNFYEATYINMKSQSIWGITLAPTADFTSTNAIEGATFVKSLTASGEVHFPTLSSDCPFDSISMMNTGAAAAAAVTTAAPTPTTTAAPTPTPSTTSTEASGSGCILGDERTCCTNNYIRCYTSAWCNANAANCGNCNAFYATIYENGDCCKGRWKSCSADSDCCGPLVCANGQCSV